MAAFDTAIDPVSSTPSSTSNATLFTSTGQTSVLVDVSNVGTSPIAVRVGVTPSGGSVHWKVFAATLIAGDGFASLGPYFLTNGDAITVGTDTSNDAEFSLTGLEDS